MDDEKIRKWSRYLIYFILAVLPLERIPSFELTFPIDMTVRLSQLAGLVLIAINLPLMWRSRRLLWRSPWRWLAGFILICLLSTGLAVNVNRAIAVTLFSVFVVLVAWAIALRFERERLGVYFRILVVSALAACAFGFYQFFGDLLGLSPSLTGLRDVYTKSVFGFPRIQSTALEPLYFGNYLLIASGLLIVAVLRNFRSRFALWALIPLLTVVWLTVSRGAMVALAVCLTIGLGAALARKRLRQAGSLVGVILVSIGLAYGLLYLGTHFVIRSKTSQSSHAIANYTKQTTNVSQGDSAEGRAMTRKLAVQAFAEQPVLGIGPGNFGSYAARKQPERFGEGGAIVNNEPLELLAETGVLGTLCLVVFVVALTRASIRLAKDGAMDYVWIYGLLLALLGILLQYQTFSTLYIMHIWVAIGLLTGLCLDRRREAVAQ